MTTTTTGTAMHPEPAHASVYQVRAGAWLRRGDDPLPPAGTPVDERALDAALSAKLVPYARSLGFTHIELLPQGELAVTDSGLPLFGRSCAAAGLQWLPEGSAAAQVSGIHGLSFDDPWQTGVAAEALRLFKVDSPDRPQRFARLRACMALLWGQPGCRRVAMGAELAQQRSWPADGGLDWHLLADPLHEGVQRLMHDLNHLRRELPALREAAQADPAVDSSVDPAFDLSIAARAAARVAAFTWLQRDRLDSAVLAFVRQHAATGNALLVVCNMAADLLREHDEQRGYRLGVPYAGRYTERLCSGSRHYAGNGPGNLLGAPADWPNGSVVTEAVAWGGFEQSLVLDLPANCTLMLEHHR